jgi:hypothetical protein
MEAPGIFSLLSINTRKFSRVREQKSEKKLNIWFRGRNKSI